MCALLYILLPTSDRNEEEYKHSARLDCCWRHICKNAHLTICGGAAGGYGLLGFSTAHAAARLVGTPFAFPFERLL